MTRDEAREVLLNGGTLYCIAWTFTLYTMNCGSYDDEYGYCCEDVYDNVEEALDSIEFYANGNWNEVEAIG
jgi:hypothetical protein